MLEKFGKSRLVADLDPDDFAKLRAAMVGKGWGPDINRERNSAYSRCVQVRARYRAFSSEAAERYLASIDKEIRAAAIAAPARACIR